MPVTARSNHPREPGDDPNIKGTLINAVRMLPKITVSKGEPSFCFLRNRVRQPKQKPLAMAMIVPKKLACVRSSAKNSAIPTMTVVIANQSAHVARL